MTKRLHVLAVVILFAVPSIQISAHPNDPPGNPPPMGKPERVESGFAGGDGSKDRPFRICTRAHLEKVRELQEVHLNRPTNAYHFQLVCELDLTGAKIAPLGELRGSFDGNGKTIRGLELDCHVTQYCGLFEIVHRSAVVEKLKVENARLYSRPGHGGARMTAGVIAGSNRGGRLRDVHVENGSIEGLFDSAGLIAGEMRDYGTIERSSSSGRVASICLPSYPTICRAGGIVGHLIAQEDEPNRDTTNTDLGGIVQSGSTADVTSSHVAGGIAGRIEFSARDSRKRPDSSLKMQDLSFSGTIRAGTVAGGVSGSFHSEAAPGIKPEKQTLHLHETVVDTTIQPLRADVAEKWIRDYASPDDVKEELAAFRRPRTHRFFSSFGLGHATFEGPSRGQKTVSGRSVGISPVALDLSGNRFAIRFPDVRDDMVGALYSTVQGSEPRHSEINENHNTLFFAQKSYKTLPEKFLHAHSSFSNPKHFSHLDPGIWTDGEKGQPRLKVMPKPEEVRPRKTQNESFGGPAAAPTGPSVVGPVDSRPPSPNTPDPILCKRFLGKYDVNESFGFLRTAFFHWKHFAKKTRKGFEDAERAQPAPFKESAKFLHEEFARFDRNRDGEMSYMELRGAFNDASAYRFRCRTKRELGESEDKIRRSCEGTLAEYRSLADVLHDVEAVRDEKKKAGQADEVAELEALKLTVAASAKDARQTVIKREVECGLFPEDPSALFFENIPSQSCMPELVGSELKSAACNAEKCSVCTLSIQDSLATQVCKSNSSARASLVRLCHFAKDHVQECIRRAVAPTACREEKYKPSPRPVDLTTAVVGSQLKRFESTFTLGIKVAIPLPGGTKQGASFNKQISGSAVATTKLEVAHLDGELSQAGNCSYCDSKSRYRCKATLSGVKIHHDMHGWDVVGTGEQQIESIAQEIDVENKGPWSDTQGSDPTKVYLACRLWYERHQDQIQERALQIIRENDIHLRNSEAQCFEDSQCKWLTKGLYTGYCQSYKCRAVGAENAACLEDETINVYYGVKRAKFRSDYFGEGPFGKPYRGPLLCGEGLKCGTFFHCDKK